MNQSDLTLDPVHGMAEESPYGVRSIKLGMWIFIISDACTFGAFLFGYGYIRVGTPNWGTPFGFSTILNATLMTFVLLGSSFTMLTAVRAAQAEQMTRALRLVAFTMVLGTLFAAMHLREWFRMFQEGWSLSSNPTGGAVQFGAAFFSITGMHLLHVISGVIVLLIVARGFSRGRFDAVHLETAGLYWHFVDLVWMFVFPLMYLMNAR